MTRAQLAVRTTARAPLPDALSERIGRWRRQRLEVRCLLVQLLSGELLSRSSVAQTQAVQALCTELIDYISTGHFEIYGSVLPRNPRPGGARHTLLQHLFHSIGTSTDAVLVFNDRFSETPPATLSQAFRQLLIRLSRGLLLRFALEEQLLELCGH